jgi:hypothetical protein
MSSDTSRAQPSAVLKATTRTGFFVLAGQHVIYDSVELSVLFVGFAVGAAELFEVIEDQMTVTSLGWHQT